MLKNDPYNITDNSTAKIYHLYLKSHKFNDYAIQKAEFRSWWATYSYE